MAGRPAAEPARVPASGAPPAADAGFVRGLGLLDSVMMVAGSMIGSGIFIVSADIARRVGASGWLLAVWAMAGASIVAGAICFGELASMMPHTGGPYVFLREAFSPLAGFLFGWAMFLVVQTGTIAAVAVGFARFLGVLVPWVSPTGWIVPPLHLGGYAVSLSTQQLVAIAMIALLTWINTRGLQAGKLVQNVFTAAKILALVALILLGLVAALRDSSTLAANFAEPWTPRPVAEQPVSAADGAYGLFVAFFLTLVGALFASGAWGDVSFASAEVRDARRTLPIALILGTVVVNLLYVLANVSYLAILPLSAIQQAPDDRVATAALQALLGPAGASLMAVAIVISTFGCNNGLVLVGARIYYAMARDGLFFRATGRLNRARVPAVGLVLQGLWAALLVLPRTRLRDAAGAPLLDPATGEPRYGNLYGNLLEYVVFVMAFFLMVAVVGLVVLRRRRPAAERPFRAWGYPLTPGFYILGVTVLSAVLLRYRAETTWPGVLIVLSGIPVYLAWRRAGTGSFNSDTRRS